MSNSASTQPASAAASAQKAPAAEQEPSAKKSKLHKPLLPSAPTDSNYALRADLSPEELDDIDQGQQVRLRQLDMRNRVFRRGNGYDGFP